MGNHNPTIYLIPRWAGNVHSDWYDWLSTEIKSKYQIDIVRLEMPDWNEPNVTESVSFLTSNIKELDENTYFIGHSVGCQAILRFLNEQSKTNKQLKIGGFLFIAGWLEVDNPWITLKPWLEIESIDFEFVSNNVGYKKLVISTNDPFTSDYERNKLLFNRYLSTKTNIYPNKLHFNNKEEIDVMREVEELILHHQNK
ncbi:MAG: alpha/beta hydrolase [Paludibacter sp.]|nr:alpha/beta hydrolase [Paludibacter sp.]